MRILVLLGGQVFSGAEITTLRFAAALPAAWAVEVLAHASTFDRAAEFGLRTHAWDSESAPGDRLLRASHFIHEPNHAAQESRCLLREALGRFKPDAVLACMFPVAMLALPILEQLNISLFVHHQLMYKDMPDHPITAPVRRVANYATRIIAASQAVDQPLQRAGISNSEVIPAGLPQTYGQPARPAHPGVPRILTIGTWGPQKGLATLLEADRLLRDEGLEYELTVAGPLDAYSQAYGTSMRKLAHAAVTFIGNQPNPERCYQDADILVVPSSQPDPYPTVALEGMAHGLAVIATDCGGLSEQVEHNSTGLLVPPEDLTRMAAALRSLICSTDVAATMGRAGRKRFESIADIKHQGRQLEACLMHHSKR
jgi:glycosyltransferase involved in cell wall biosynthesis